MFEIKDLRVHYDKVEAVKGISFSMGEGDFICLVGANGAGKTTTLRTISGLKKPTSGEIWFQGAIINGLPPAQIAKIGIIQVPEGRRNFFYLTVLENLMVGAHANKDKKKVKSRLESVFQRFPRLAERRKQKAGTLSGGNSRC